MRAFVDCEQGRAAKQKIPTTRCCWLVLAAAPPGVRDGQSEMTRRCLSAADDHVSRRTSPRGEDASELGHGGAERGGLEGRGRQCESRLGRRATGWKGIRGRRSLGERRYWEMRKNNPERDRSME